MEEARRPRQARVHAFPARADRIRGGGAARGGSAKRHALGEIDRGARRGAAERHAQGAGACLLPLPARRGEVTPAHIPGTAIIASRLASSLPFFFAFLASAFDFASAFLLILR